jgi:hypothetical protein
MTIENYQQILIAQCQDTTGFISRLYVENQFDNEQYNILVEALAKYANAIIEEDTMNRQVAGCLFFLEETLANLAAQYNGQNPLSEHGRKIQHAHAQIWEWVNQIFAVEMG